MPIIVKHMTGNMQSRWPDFLTSDGEKPGRDRDAEFEDPPHDAGSVDSPHGKRAGSVYSLHWSRSPMRTCNER